MRAVVLAWLATLPQRRVAPPPTPDPKPIKAGTIIIEREVGGTMRIYEPWWREWVDGGLAVLDHYRARHLEFARYLEEQGQRRG